MLDHFAEEHLVELLVGNGEALRVLDPEVGLAERAEVAAGLGERPRRDLRGGDGRASLDEPTRIGAAAAADLEDLLARLRIEGAEDGPEPRVVEEALVRLRCSYVSPSSSSSPARLS